jgi:ABC-type polysaccharide/polyol phosphate transport system ATPase subunit
MITLENVSVKYRLVKERPRTFQEYVINYLKGKRLEAETLWALTEISLRINKGESFGVIGPNGAGKSTLLKIIAGVIRPAEGSVIVDGKIAPLIELGAGFDHELTGKENIYLNASILGFSRKEIEAKFERIKEFSELQDFINTPLKNYSSGMVARLGFSIATEVDPDILIIDEILAVGDERFRKKCHERIKSFKDKGMTILFVSHNMNDITRLCDRAVCLKHGRIVFEGSSVDASDYYMNNL